MRWFIYNNIFSVIVLEIMNYYSELKLNKPIIFISSYFVVFMSILIFSRIFNKKAFIKFYKLFKFILFFARESIISNLRVASDILTPGFKTRPAIVAVPLDLNTDFEIVTLASVITLTPGTLSLMVSEDKKTLFVHEMYVPEGNAENVIQNIKNGFERRIKELSE